MTQIGYQNLLHPTPDAIAGMPLDDLAYPASHPARITPRVAQSRSYPQPALAR